ncbi:hypothetical protein AOLI_G00277070 [Acnodon oligacanthus]
MSTQSCQAPAFVRAVLNADSLFGHMVSYKSHRAQICGKSNVESGDLWGMTVEQAEGGQGLCDPRHPSLS